MAIRHIQSVFTLGEIDPRLFSRVDFEGYYKGAKKLRDFVCIPQGGAKRRFGLSYAATIVDTGDANAPITDTTEVNGYTFDFSADKKFEIVARPNDRTGTPGVSFNIYLDGTLKDTETTTDYAITDIATLHYIDQNNRVIILHEDHNPKQLVRTNDTTWTLSDISFDYVPTYDFSVIDGVSYRGSSFTFTPAAATGSGINLTASSAIFDAGHVGGIYIGGGGIARITSVSSTTVAVMDILDDFPGTSAIKGANSLLLSSAWGDFTGGTPAGQDRGWPSRGTFFQSRLALGRTPQLLNLFSLSNINDFYNFDDSEATAVNAFSLAVRNEIYDLTGIKGLVALTSGTVEATSMFRDTPLQAGNAMIDTASFRGSANLEARIVDNQIMYISENSTQVNAAAYDINGGFDVIDVSVLSPKLVTNPTSTASYAPATENGSFLMITNADGTMAAFQSLVAQNVQGWTLLRTQGSFIQALASGESGATLVRRKINTGATVTGDPDNVFTANTDFEGVQNITTAASTSSTDVDIFAEDGDYLIIGSEAPFDRIAVVLDTAASTDLEPTFEYYDSTGNWTTFSPTDGTSGFTGNGSITWDVSADNSTWYPQEFPGSVPDSYISAPVRKFWVRIKRATTNAVTTTPIEETININTANRIHLEDFDFDVYTDSTESTTSDANGLVTGLDHLVGHMVYARVDDTPYGPYFVDSSGEITISEVSSTVEVGVNYYPEMIGMPPVAQLQYGTSVYRPKHIKSIYIDYYSSLGILVNGQEIQGLALGEFELDATPVGQTGFAEMVPMRGWDPRSDNTISQELPLPMTIIGIGYLMETT